MECQLEEVIRINDTGMAAAKTIIEVNTMKAMYALNAISTPPFLS